MSATVAIQAPPCPPWCTVTHELDGWDRVDSRDVTRECQHPLVNDGPVEVTLAQFVSIETGRIEVEEPIVRLVLTNDSLSIDEARALAAALERAAALAAA